MDIQELIALPLLRTGKVQMRDFTLDEMQAYALANVAADRAQQAVQEPVAWRFRDTDTLVPAMPGYEPKGEHWIPLYAAPQPAQQSAKPEVQRQAGQEPALIQYCMAAMWRKDMARWSEWEDCTAAQAADYERVKVVNDWEYQVRRLYAAPQPAQVPLTPEQYMVALGLLRDEMVCSAGTLKRIVRAIEQAHGIVSKR